VRDLVDMVLLIHSGTLARATVAEAIRLTFDRRGTHAAPNPLPQPPTDWQRPYNALAKECGLSGTITGAFAVLHTYLSEGGLITASFK
jgi:hypothetical protein